jgi:caffeoyl-CoA O-methyltransferase
MNRTEYIQSVFLTEDDVLNDVIKSIDHKGMPMISVSPESGKLLTMLVQLSGAKQLLEIGALGGYSGVCLLRGSEDHGHLTSLELEEEYASVAHENLKKAGFGEKVKYIVGEALHSLAQLETDQRKFDLIFIDADKENYSNYLEWAIRLGQPGTLIVADNTLWGDRVLDENETDTSTVFLRAYNKQVAQDERLDSILIPIGDGLTIARVK